ncbi:hypothetical protein O7627_02580 [Solwaraspora sp. WMMD1047]|uniref:hypothetical protein n=1 Tax=Solwaraspora sp. WMMD1047 TaxID=3016102 RepID=UPI0024177960|nr:hypothetical protein [Solwaraspora sp. WMMD1047]MDG4828189.1 hypothetical protein [Solwaraspora sp. WMMD1047]
MRSRLLRVATAALLSVVVTLPLGARPVHAAIDWGKVITAAIGAIGSWLGSNGTQAAIQEATRQILAAVNTARSDILAHMETIAVADARSCANHAVIEFIDIERMTPDNMQRFAQDATGCAVRIDSLLPAITDKARVDQLGIALNVVAPIALVARARTGLTTDALENTLRAANVAIIPKLAPSCTVYSYDFDPELPLPSPGQIVTYHLYCWAYNNDGGSHSVFLPYPQAPTDQHFAVAQDQATRNTSRAIAQRVLPLF